MRFFFTYLLITLLTFSQQVASAQQTEDADKSPYFLLEGRVKTQTGNAENTRMVLSENGKTIRSFTLDKNGKYSFELDYNRNFVLRVSKSGYYQKIFNINTTVSNHILYNNIDFPPLTENITLIELNQLINDNFQNQAYAEISYSASIDNIDIRYLNSDNDILQQIADAKEEQKLLASELNASDRNNDRIDNSADKQYDSLINNGNLAFNRGDYLEARGKYEQALALRPNESYPSERLSELEMIIMMQEEQNAIEEQYKEQIAQGDTKFDAKDYSEAIGFYQKALELKTNDIYALRQIGKSKAFQLNAETNAQYTELISQADVALNGNELENARNYYLQAKEVKPTEQYPQIQIAKINKTLNEIARKERLEQEYQNAMNSGQQLLASHNYDDAKLAFYKALEYKPKDELATAKLAEANGALLRQLQNEEYAQIIKNADRAYEIESWNEAEKLYTEASKLLPNEKHPTDRLDLIAQIKQYEQLLITANNHYNSKEWSQALSVYQQVIATKSNQEASTRIAEINEHINQANINEQYREAISKADASFDAKEYKNAIDIYQSALAIKANESYPTEQIEKANNELAKIDAQQAAEEQKKRYYELIEQADNAFNQEQWQSARDLYTQAGGIKDYMTYPVEQIAKIDQTLARIEERNKIDEQYTSIMSMGNQQMNSQTYANAIETYNQALALKRNDTEANTMLSKAKAALLLQQQNEEYTLTIGNADKAFNTKDWNNAEELYTTASRLLPNEEYPKSQLSIIASAKQVELKLEQANSLFEFKEWKKAKDKYNEALAIQADIIEAKNRIAEIDKIIEQEELDNKYAEIIKEADSNFNTEKYEVAISNYQAAISVKANESYPKEQIEKANNAIAALAAQEIARQEEAENKKREEYKTLISAGDIAFSSQQYIGAKKNYTDALILYANELHPSKQIATIEKILEQEAKIEELITEGNTALEAKDIETALAKYNEVLSIGNALNNQSSYINARIEKAKAIAASLQIEKQYLESIAIADNLYNNEAYAEARLAYEKAMEIKTDEEYPQKQILYIKRELARIDAEKRIKDEQENEYNELIKKADKEKENLNLAKARHLYTQAQKILPTENYPAQQLEAIEKMQTQTVEANIQKQYDESIKKADSELSIKNYAIAKFYYNKALEVIAWKEYPKEQIENINKITRVELSEDQKVAYNGYIKDANEALNQKNLAVARSYFQRALAINQGDDESAAKLIMIEEKIKRTDANQEEQQYLELIEKADAALAEAKYSVARSYYNQALNIKANDNYSKTQLRKIKEILDNR